MPDNSHRRRGATLMNAPPDHVPGPRVDMVGPAQWISQAEVLARYDVSRVTLWDWQRKHAFPRPVYLTPGTGRYRLADVLAWEAARMAGSIETSRRRSEQGKLAAAARHSASRKQKRGHRRSTSTRSSP